MSGDAFRLAPVDSLFFRDSRPFDAGAFQAEVESLFPPSARTLVGALRLAFARAMGYRGPSKWTGTLSQVLGDGPNDLGELSFRGPFLYRDAAPLYPMPLHVRGKREKDASGNDTFEATTLLVPGNDEILCDLGRVRLLERKQRTDRFDSSAGTFVTRRGLEAILLGELPTAAQTVCAKQLYEYEPRVGLERNRESRTATKGMLYSTVHVRLQEGVSLVVEVNGLPNDAKKNQPKMIPLGGESRMTFLESASPLQSIKAPVDAIMKTGNVAITLLTPLELTKATMQLTGDCFEDFAGVRVVSACLGKPIYFGGWDSLSGQPIALSPYLPAGSTWFCEVDENARERIAKTHETCIGSEKAFGLGQITLGTW